MVARRGGFKKIGDPSQLPPWSYVRPTAKVDRGVEVGAEPRNPSKTAKFTRSIGLQTCPKTVENARFERYRIGLQRQDIPGHRPFPADPPSAEGALPGLRLRFSLGPREARLAVDRVLLTLSGRQLLHNDRYGGLSREQREQLLDTLAMLVLLAGQNGRHADGPAGQRAEPPPSS